MIIWVERYMYTVVFNPDEHCIAFRLMDSLQRTFGISLFDMTGFYTQKHHVTKIPLTINSLIHAL